MGGRGVAVVVAALAWLGASALGAAPAHAGLLDTAKLTISAPGAAGEPQVAVTPSGWTLVVWTTGKHVIAGAWRPPGGVFGPEHALGQGQLGLHDIVATADDKVALQWDSDDRVAHAMVLDQGATKGPTTAVTGPTFDPVSSLVGDAQGNVVSIVPTTDGLVASSRAPGGVFAPAQVLAPGITTYVFAAANAAGDIAVIFLGPDYNEYFVERPAGSATFGAPQRAPVPGGGYARIAVTDAGDVAVFAAGDGVAPGSSTAPVLAIRPPGGQFTVRAPGVEPDVMLPDSGNRLAIFDNAPNPPGTPGHPFGGVIRVRDRTPDGAFTDPVTFTPPNSCFEAPTVTPTDDTVVAFETSCAADFTGARIAVAERPSGGAFGPSTTISPPNSSMPAIAVSPSGALAVAWSNGLHPGDVSSGVVQAVVRDGSAELGLVNAGQVAVSTAQNSLDFVLGCTGLHDCHGTLELLAPASRGRATRLASAHRQTLARRTVSLARGTRRRLRLHVASSRLRTLRTARVAIDMARVRHAVARRTITVHHSRRRRRG